MANFAYSVRLSEKIHYFVEKSILYHGSFTKSPKLYAKAVPSFSLATHLLHAVSQEHLQLRAAVDLILVVGPHLQHTATLLGQKLAQTGINLFISIKGMKMR